VFVILFTNIQVNDVIGLAGASSWFYRGIIEIENFLV
jgi:hypothetical protein